MQTTSTLSAFRTNRQLIASEHLCGQFSGHHAPIPGFIRLESPVTRGAYDMEGFPAGALLMDQDGSLWLNISPLCGNTFYEMRPVSPVTWKCGERQYFPSRRWVHDYWVQIGQVAR